MKKVLNTCTCVSMLATRMGPVHDLVYLPQMCSRNTHAMKSRLITKTGTGPLQCTERERERERKEGRERKGGGGEGGRESRVDQQ